MTAPIALKKEIQASPSEAVERVTEALKAQGFGILTRIDMHTKVKEKLGKDMPPVIILGACNPKMAYEAYSTNSDVTSLLPCNAVIRELSPGKVSVELALPSELMKVIGDSKLTRLANDADSLLKRALEALH